MTAEQLQFHPLAFTGAVLLFSLTAIGMLVLPLVIGLFVRPSKPQAEKESAYECGEPAIGASNVQFDLRFYVVALLFIVFDVEVAFFFPWAVVFGKANTLAKPDTRLSQPARMEVSAAMFSKPSGAVSADPRLIIPQDAARRLRLIAFCDMLVFFFVIIIGFAYLWRRGDLDWVRSVAQQRASELRLTQEPRGDETTLPAAALAT